METSPVEAKNEVTNMSPEKKSSEKPAKSPQKRVIYIGKKKLVLAKPASEAIVMTDQFARKTVQEPIIAPLERKQLDTRLSYILSRHVLIDQYNYSFPMVTERGMRLRKELVAPQIDDIAIPCYDCHIGRHKNDDPVSPKDDDVLSQCDGFKPSCPIVLKLNQRYRQLNLKGYSTVEEKIRGLYNLHKYLIRGMFKRSYLVEGCIRFLHDL